MVSRLDGRASSTRTRHREIITGRAALVYIMENYTKAICEYCFRATVGRPGRDSVGIGCCERPQGTPGGCICHMDSPCPSAIWEALASPECGAIETVLASSAGLS